MEKDEKRTVFIDVLVISVSLMIFSFFTQYELPLKSIAFVALLVAAFIISKYFSAPDFLRTTFGTRYSAGKIVILSGIGIVAGFVLAVFYRYYHDWGLLPDRLGYFIVVAMLIGGAEELLFRGFLQGLLNRINGIFSVLFSTAAHTGYKTFLFMAPVLAEKPDVGFIFVWTFGVGLCFGFARHFTKSLWIPLAAHIVFDAVSYAGFTLAPWWVW